MKWLVRIGAALVTALLLPGLLGDSALAGSVWSVLLILLLIPVFSFAPWKRPLSAVLSHLGGLLYAMLTAFGAALESTGAVDWRDGGMWLAIFCYAHVFARLIGFAWEFLRRTEHRLSDPSKLDKLPNWLPWLALPVIFLCWLPCWLATWPGNFVYDATREYAQLAKGFRGDFPMLHSALITPLLQWSEESTGSVNTGIAIFTGGQMLLLAAMFTHMLARFWKLGANRLLVLVLGIYCAAFPGIHVLVTSTVRDVLFSGLLTYSVFLLWDLSRTPEEMRWWRGIGPAVVCVLTVYSRNNNSGLLMPLALCAVALLLLWMGGKKGWKGALSFGMTALVAWFCVGGILANYCGELQPASSNSSLTVLTQSLSRAYTLEKENWTKAEREEFEGYFNMNGFSYVPENGDSTKGRLQLKEEGEAFLRFWLKMGLRYPGHYAEAYLLNTKALWLPGAVMDGYQENRVGVYVNYEKCWFYYADGIEAPATLESKLPRVHDWYQNLSLMISFEKIPVVSQLFSVGFHFWLLLFACLYALERRARKLYLPLALLLGYMAVSSLVPLMLLRYFGAIFFAFPLVCLFLLQPGKTK